MWINDMHGHNAVSVLISIPIRLLDKSDPNIVAVQYFIDHHLGRGIIYNASDLRYYRLHYTKFLRNKLAGEITHQQVITNITVCIFALVHRLFDWRFEGYTGKNHIVTSLRIASIFDSSQLKIHIHSTTK